MTFNHYHSDNLHAKPPFYMFKKKQNIKNIQISL